MKTANKKLSRKEKLVYIRERLGSWKNLTDNVALTTWYIQEVEEELFSYGWTMEDVTHYKHTGDADTVYKMMAETEMEARFDRLSVVQSQWDRRAVEKSVRQRTDATKLLQWIGN